MAITTQGYVQRTLVNGSCEMVGAFTGAGGTADPVKVYGESITSVAYNSSTGKYLITFTETPYQVPLIYPVIMDSADNKWNVKIGAWTAASKTLVIWCYADTTLTNIPTTATLGILGALVDSTQPV